MTRENLYIELNEKEIEDLLNNYFKIQDGRYAKVTVENGNLVIRVVEEKIADGITIKESYIADLEDVRTFLSMKLSLTNYEVTNVKESIRVGYDLASKKPYEKHGVIAYLKIREKHKTKTKKE